MLLLCLVFHEEAFAQKCLSMRYDACGNRTSLMHVDCGYELEEVYARDMLDVICEDRKLVEDVLLYPNPSDGVYKINLKDDEMMNPIVVQVYNNNGILIVKETCYNYHEIDISDKPAGAYLVRIIKDDVIYRRIVVKL